MNITGLKNTESETGWKPTAYLRYVPGLRCNVHEMQLANAAVTKSGYIHQKLQQLWINSDGRDEWRDVPFVE